MIDSLMKKDENCCLVFFAAFEWVLPIYILTHWFILVSAKHEGLLFYCWVTHTDNYNINITSHTSVEMGTGFYDPDLLQKTNLRNKIYKTRIGKDCIFPIIKVPLCMFKDGFWLWIVWGYGKKGYWEFGSCSGFQNWC